MYLGYQFHVNCLKLVYIVLVILVSVKRTSEELDPVFLISYSPGFRPWNDVVLLASGMDDDEIMERCMSAYTAFLSENHIPYRGWDV